MAVLGNSTGILCHVFAAILGLSAILAYSAAAYAYVKWIGVLYLLYLGIRTIRQSSTSRTNPSPIGLKSYFAIYRDGVLVNVFNPKVALLMLALLPQFVDSNRGSATIQIVFAGVIHVLIATIVLTIIVLVANRSADMFRSSQASDRIFRWVAGSLLVGLGIRMALADRGPD